MDEKISIIIPVFKVEEYLDECLISVIGQTYKNLEIILVDDGSPDRCPQMCEYWAKKDSRIVVIHKDNGGLSDARNAGLDRATGEFIGFVDSDDWIRPEMYEVMLNTLLETNADICACNICSCEGDKKTYWGSHEYFIGDSEQMLARLYNDSQYPVAAWNKLYRKKCWETLRFPKGKICEDAFTTYQLIHDANIIVQITNPFYCYRIRPQSIMTASFRKQKMDEEEAWRRNYEFVKEIYPALSKMAFDFYLQRVNRMLITMTQSDREKYQAEYRYLNKIRKQNILYVLFLSHMRFKYRVKYLVDSVKG